MKKVFSLIILLICSVLSISASSQREEYTPSDEILHTINSIKSIRDEMFMDNSRTMESNEESFQYYISSLSFLEKEIIKLDNNYLSAFYNFQVFQAYEIYNDNEKAYEVLKLAESQIITFLETESYSRALSLYGDILVRGMSYIGGMTSINNSNKSKDLYERAIKGNSENAMAYIGLGLWYLFAPEIAGGSAEISQKLLDKASELGDEYEKYLANTWLTFVYYKNMDNKRAKENINSIIVDYPNSQWLSNIKENLEDGRDLFSMGNKAE